MVAFLSTTTHGEQSYTPSAGTSASRTLWERAAKISPQGAQGEGKYYSPYPHFIQKAKGARVWDVDGNEYVDYWNGAGPCVLGHADDVVNEAVVRSMSERGNLYCAPHELEVRLCEKLAIPRFIENTKKLLPRAGNWIRVGG
jgi:glutamate-1-semialdehyde 2,1-aminomutase